MRKQILLSVSLGIGLSLAGCHLDSSLLGRPPAADNEQSFPIADPGPDCRELPVVLDPSPDCAGGFDLGLAITALEVVDGKLRLTLAANGSSSPPRLTALDYFTLDSGDQRDTRALACQDVTAASDTAVRRDYECTLPKSGNDEDSHAFTLNSLGVQIAACPQALRYATEFADPRCEGTGWAQGAVAELGARPFPTLEPDEEP